MRDYVPKLTEKEKLLRFEKTVFLTKEAAEQALKRMESE